MNLTKEEIELLEKLLPQLKEQLENERMQSLLEEAKRRYPIGTKFKTVFYGDVKRVLEGNFKIYNRNFSGFNELTITVDGNYLWGRDMWAEIIEEPKEIRKEYTLVDGSKVYEGDRVWYFDKKHLTIGSIYMTINVILEETSEFSQCYKSEEDCKKALQEYLENQPNISWKQIEQLKKEYIEGLEVRTYGDFFTFLEEKLKPKLSE